MLTMKSFPLLALLSSAVAVAAVSDVTSGVSGVVPVLHSSSAMTMTMTTTTSLPGTLTLQRAVQEGYDPWKYGTTVYREFDDGWYQGSITAYGQSSYTVAWEDGTTDTFHDLAQVDQMVADAQYIPGGNPNDSAVVYDPWADGTNVFKEFDDGGYQGTISWYDESTGLYTVTWSDGDVETYPGAGAGDEIDQLVEAAAATLEGAGSTTTSPKFEFETVVYKEFEDGWYQGAVTSYEAGVYTVLWSDGTVETYGNDEISQMVADAATIPDPTTNTSPNYAFETVVYKSFEDGWYQGEITSYDAGVYTITWSDGDIEAYGEEEIAQMVADAANIPKDSGGTADTSSSSSNPKYAFDTVVSKEFEDGWYQGDIVWYQDGMYSVNWSDGEMEEYEEDEIAQMVADAAQNGSSAAAASAAAGSNNGLNAGGTVFLVICVAVAVAVGITCSARKHRTGKEVEAQLSDQNLNEAYSDHVDTSQPSPDII
jgi:hypothetical protein